MNPVTRSLHCRGRLLAGGRLPAICVPLLGTESEQVLREAQAAVAQGADLLEWRADFFASLGDCSAVTDLLSQLRKSLPEIPLLFTIRSATQGGESIALSRRECVEIQQSVIDSQLVDFVDFELVMPIEDSDRLVERCRARAVQVIFSQHDFSSTPDGAVIEGFFRAAQVRGGDVGKVAVMPQRSTDVLTLLSATLRAAGTLEIPLISMAMGSLGLVSRVFGPDFGSAVTFAALGRASAPGQVSIDRLRAVLESVKD